MNETIKNLVERRSCKDFSGRQIKKSDLEQILKAGMFAPNGIGAQSPIILVVQDKEDVATLSRLNAAVMKREGIDPFYGAPTVLVVMADKNIPTHVEDGSLVIGNMLNAAHSLGLGSCWIHRAKEQFQSEEGKAFLKKFGVQDNFVGIGNCVLGYANSAPKPAKPRKADYVRRKIEG